MDNKNKKTASGIDVKPYYGQTPAGEYPFTSGIYPNMYRDRLWTMRQYAGFSSAEKSNERYQYLLIYQLKRAMILIMNYLLEKLVK